MQRHKNRLRRAYFFVVNNLYTDFFVKKLSTLFRLGTFETADFLFLTSYSRARTRALSSRKVAKVTFRAMLPFVLSERPPLRRLLPRAPFTDEFPPSRLE